MNPINCLPDFSARGLISQVTNFPTLAERMATQSVKPYGGFDPTAPSLHVGSLMQLKLLQRFQQHGHPPIVLVGGATGMIGDPSGKTAERKLIGVDTVHQWAESLHRQIEPFLDFSGQAAARMVNNHDWFVDMGVLEFLRDVAKLVTVNTMLGRDAVKLRLDRPEVGMSVTEFAYPLLQGYDFACLNRHFGCDLQIGGSDQWGNIVMGLEMTRKLNGTAVYGLTTPLVTKADGTKFGKSEAGNVWLNPGMTSPYAFFQFWLNTADADVQTYLNYFTDLSVRDICDLVEADRSSGIKPQAQRVLAELVTTLVHGRDAVLSSQRISNGLFGRGVHELREGDLAQLALDGLPATTAPREDSSLPALLVNTGLVESRTQARTLLRQQAVLVNGQAISADEEVQEGQRLFGKYTLLQRGHKRHALVVWH